MKPLLAVVLACFSAQAQTVSIPLSAIAHIYHHAPNDVTFRRTANAALQMFSAGDYVTTIRYGSPGGPLCEQNAVFLLKPCVLNVRKFTAAKAAILAFGIGQEAVELVPAFQRWRYREPWERATGLVDLGLAAPIGVGFVGNARLIVGR